MKKGREKNEGGDKNKVVWRFYVASVPVREFALIYGEYRGQSSHSQGLRQRGLFVAVNLHQPEHAAYEQGDTW